MVNLTNSELVTNQSFIFAGNNSYFNDLNLLCVGSVDNDIRWLDPAGENINNQNVDDPVFETRDELNNIGGTVLFQNSDIDEGTSEGYYSCTAPDEEGIEQIIQVGLFASTRGN